MERGRGIKQTATGDCSFVLPCPGPLSKLPSFPSLYSLSLFVPFRGSGDVTWTDGRNWSPVSDVSCVSDSMAPIDGPSFDPLATHQSTQIHTSRQHKGTHYATNSDPLARYASGLLSVVPQNRNPRDRVAQERGAFAQFVESVTQEGPPALRRHRFRRDRLDLPVIHLVDDQRREDRVQASDQVSLDHLRRHVGDEDLQLDLFTSHEQS